MDFMSTMNAFAMGEANRGNEQKVFDWNKCARIIKEKEVTQASAGLIEDWFWTGDEIYIDDKPNLECHPYLASTWATPTLVINDDEEEIECYVMASETEWNSDTVWPTSALEILNNKEGEE